MLYPSYISIDLYKKMLIIVHMDTFSALADPTRRNIIELLVRQGRLTTNEIVSNFQISQPAISQHLKVLREAKLVDMDKHAQKHYYKVTPHKFLELEGWIRQLTQIWHERFDSLETLLGEETKGGEK